VSRHVLVAGAGWLGTALGRALLAGGDRVTAVRRHPGLPPGLEGTGAAALALDLAEPGAERALPADLDAIVACQAAGGDGVEGYERAYVLASRALLARAAARAGTAFVYTGSTGVFGQRDGSDVDERTPPAPASPTAEVLVRAEEEVLAAARGGVRACVLRLSGLYGPGRVGVVERVRSGAMALGPGDDAWTNWCHQEDAVAAVLAVLARGRPGGVYHASDAQPLRRWEVVRWVAGRLGIEPPRRGAPAVGQGAPNRRVIATQTRADLAIPLRYACLQDGLAPLVPAP
jgi:nucleoside-diphosphate-sugar epimerase